MFNLNDKVVYPGYGVATITRVFEKRIGEQITVLYELKFVNKDMMVMVPKDRCEEVGIRALSSEETIEEVFGLLTKPSERFKTYDSTAVNWNKRHKEYQNKLRKGSLKEISEIYKDLKTIAKHKELSFGEKTLLSKTEGLLAEEISAAQKLDEDKAIEQLRSFFVIPHTSFTQHTI